MITDSPQLANQFANGLQCIISSVKDAAISGTHRLTGVSIDYLNGVCSSAINPPFIDPLNCFEEGIVDMRQKFDFIFDTEVNDLKQKYQPMQCKLKIRFF